MSSKVKLLLILSLFFSVLFAGANDVIEAALAEEDFEKALQLAKSNFYVTQNAKSYYYLGAAYEGIGRPKLADAAYQNFLKAPYEEGNGELAFLVAGYYEKKEQFTKASAGYEYLVKNASDDDQTVTRLGQLYFKQERYKEVIKLFKGLLEKDESRANPLAYYIGVSYYILNDHKAAEEYIEKAIAAGFSDGDAYLKLGDLKIGKGDYSKGIEYIAEGIKLTDQPIPAATYNNLGVAYKNLGQSALARDAFRKAISSGSKSVAVYNNFAKAALDINDYNGVIQTLGPKAYTYDNNGEYLYSLAYAYDNSDSYKEALNYYQKALAAGAGNAEFIRDRIEDLELTID
jgi:tetratricopeptide (TPR) repeat protein